MKKPFNRLREMRIGILVTAVSATLLATGCGNKSPDELVASAEAYLSKGDANAAVIELKNALQQAPDNGVARLRLGETLLQTRDFISAEKELRRALDLKQPEAKVLPSLVAALSEMAKYDTIVQEFGDRQLDDKAAQARFRTLVGDAALQTGERAFAQKAYDQALAADANYGGALLGKAMLAAFSGELGEAERQVDAVLANHPNLARAHVFKGDLRLATGDMTGARSALEKATKADTTFLPGQFALVALLINEKAMDEAKAQLAAIRKVEPRDLRISYFEALLAYRQGDVTKARENVQQVLKVLPAHTASLVLAGAIDLQTGSLAGAEANLSKVVRQVPAHSAARGLLVQTLLRMGQPGRAQEVLQPLEATPAIKEPQFLLLAGETYLANGDPKRAADFYQQATAAGQKQQQAQAHTRLGQIALATGRADEGFKELQTASELDEQRYQADLAAIAAHLKNNKIDEAMAAAKKLESKQPKNPLTFHMYGVVNLAKRDNDAARASFAKALELQPTYLPAAMNLAMMDIADKKPEEARRRIEAVIQKDPKNERAHLALADILARTGGGTKEVVSAVMRGVSANPQSAEARLALIALHLRANDAKSALSAAQEAAAALPRDGRILNALATAQETSGEVNQAIETLNRLAALNPSQPEPLLRLGGLYARQKETDRAISALRKAQALAVKERDVVPQLVQVFLSGNRYDDALKEVRDLQRKEPKFAGGYALEGDILLAQRKLSDAEASFREALKLEPKNTAIAIRLHGVLEAQKKAAEADALQKRWLSANPADMAMRIYLGDLEIRDKNFKAAAPHYQAVVAAQPNNVLALNNLAWIGGETGDTKALSYAERAAKLAPSNAAVLDTYGMLLVKRGETSKGLEVLAKAKTLAPERNDIRVNYAKALIQAGRKEEARKELDALKSVAQDFPGKSEIEKLMKSL